MNEEKAKETAPWLLLAEFLAIFGTAIGAVILVWAMMACFLSFLIA